MLWARWRHLSSGGTLQLSWDTSVGALHCSSDIPDPRQLTPGSGSTTLGVSRAFSRGLSSGPLSKDNCLENAEAVLRDIAISSPSRMVLASRWRHFFAILGRATKRGKTWAFLLPLAFPISWVPTLGLEVSPPSEPTSPCPLVVEYFAAQSCTVNQDLHPSTDHSLASWKWPRATR